MIKDFQRPNSLVTNTNFDRNFSLQSCPRLRSRSQIRQPSSDPEFCSYVSAVKLALGSMTYYDPPLGARGRESAAETTLLPGGVHLSISRLSFSLRLMGPCPSNDTGCARASSEDCERSVSENQTP